MPIAKNNETLMDLWPMLYAILSEESNEHDNKASGEFRLDHLFAAASVPVQELEDDYGRVPLTAVGSWLTRQTEERASRVILALIDEIMGHAARSSRLNGWHKEGKKAAFLQRVETLCKRCGWAIVEGQALPLTLHLPTEITTLSGDDRDDLLKAIDRYRLGDTSGAVTSIIAMVDALCKSILSDQIDEGTFRNLPLQTKITRAYIAKLSSIRDSFIAEGIEPSDADLICLNQRKSMSTAGFVLGRYRSRFADAHGSHPTPGKFVQAALDSAVYVVRVLGVS